MATKIRLARHGSKKRPYYWIVVTDSRSPRDGAFIEKIGVYDPFQRPGEKAKIDNDLALRWLKNGAQPTDRVAKLLDQSGVRKAKHSFNPTQGLPKAKAKQRLGDITNRVPSVQLVELSIEDLATAKNILTKALAVDR